MKILQYAYQYFYTYDENKDLIQETIEELSKNLNSNINDIRPELFHITNYFIKNKPQKYWDKDIAKKTYEELSKLLDSFEYSSIPDSAWEHFFISWNTFLGTTESMLETENISSYQETKTRLYRIPSYINILEGCLSNIYKFILLILNETVDGKDFGSQNKLKPICDVLSKYGFNELISSIDIDIRNSINHGGVVIEKDSTIFQFNKSGSLEQKKLKYYEFDSLLEKTYDLYSGIFMGIIKYFILNPTIFDSINYENLFLRNEIYKLRLSTPTCKCKYVDFGTFASQVNLHMHLNNSTKENMGQIGLTLALICYDLFPEYENYFIGFSHPRLNASFIKFEKNMVEKAINQEIDLPKLFTETLNKQNAMLWDLNEEEIDEAHAKYYRFPKLENDEWQISKIEDISLEARKRFKCNLFINSIKSKNEVLKIVKSATAELLQLYNPPMLNMSVKHGDIEADMLFITVYIEDKRNSKELFINNDNFVLSVQYSNQKNGFLKHGGVMESLWNSYIREKENKLVFAWNPNYLSKL